MKEYLLVDGYNIINAWPFLEKIKNQNFEHARDKLIQVLSNYQGITKKKIILVFDAHLVPGGSRHGEELGGVEVIFTKENETADALIERLLGMIPSGVPKSVATSDWAEQRMALAKGAIRISALELLGMVQTSERQINKFKGLETGFSRALDLRLT